ncbi:hypothetical protein [Streptomyces sp. NRRL F-5135]|uniref:hypothetical protein n=1 Tax=Streptomyces sp. NRRL F-5135 TaxID=1463858 RepID=UPI00131BAAF0|nr:hypothetical protein [Streptomyces sp. NRRL F-5135]
MNDEEQGVQDVVQAAEGDEEAVAAGRELPGRLGDRLPQYRQLSDRLREINHRSRYGRV